MEQLRKKVFHPSVNREGAIDLESTNKPIPFQVFSQSIFYGGVFVFYV